MDDDDPSENDELRRLIEDMIKPQVQRLVEQLQDMQISDPEQLTHIDLDLPEGLEELGGEAMMVAGTDAEAMQDMLGTIRDKLQEGYSLDYILQEHTDLHFDRVGDKQVGNIHVSYLQMDASRQADAPHKLTAEQLREMFDRE
jgi:hypothetical protein